MNINLFCVICLHFDFERFFPMTTFIHISYEITISHTSNKQRKQLSAYYTPKALIKNVNNIEINNNKTQTEWEKKEKRMKKIIHYLFIWCIFHWKQSTMTTRLTGRSVGRSVDSLVDSCSLELLKLQNRIAPFWMHAGFPTRKISLPFFLFRFLQSFFLFFFHLLFSFIFQQQYQ